MSRTKSFFAFDLFSLAVLFGFSIVALISPEVFLNFCVCATFTSSSTSTIGPILLEVCLFSSADDKSGYLHSLVTMDNSGTTGEGSADMKQVFGTNQVPIRCQRSNKDPLGIR